jgi:hypothetical protein
MKIPFPSPSFTQMSVQDFVLKCQSKTSCWHQSITYYYRRELRQPMDTRIVKDFHLMKEQYLLGKVDWMIKDIEAWDSMCEWWASPEFRAKSGKTRANQMSKSLMHHYGIGGHIRKDQRMVWYSYSSSAIIMYKFVYNIEFFIAEG